MYTPTNERRSFLRSEAWQPFRLRNALLGGFAWLLFFCLLTALGWFGLHRHLQNTAAQTEQQALDDAAKAARSYAAYLRQVLTSTDQLILSIKYGWERTGGKLSLEQMRESGIFVASPDFYVGIFDAQGRLLTNTVPGSTRTNALQAPFFVRQMDTEADYLYIGMPTVGTFTKREVVRFSRKLIGPDGRFAGIIVGSVTTRYLTAEYESLGLHRHDFLGIVGEDGAVRASRIGEAVHSTGTPPPFEAPLTTITHGNAVWEGPNRFEDGRTRYVGWASIPDFPLFALVGFDRIDAFAAYEDYRERLIRNGMLATAAFALFTLVAGLLWMHLSWRKHLNTRTQAAYRMATECGTEGFYIIEPITDAQGALLDVELIDCNRMGAQFLGCAPARLIGHRASELYGGRLPDPVLQLLRTAFDRQEYEGEIRVMEDSPFHIEWAQYKFVRSGDRLAVALRDVSGTKEHVNELERRSNEDALTRLPNRHWLNNYLPRALASAWEKHAMLAILFIDLDGFKRVNDMMGHDIGDELLRNAGRRLKVAVRPGDHVVRVGGDEFVVVIENIHQSADAAHVAERILNAFQEAFKLSKGIHSVGTSIGISMFPADGDDATRLMKNADIAMYSVKTAGKRNFRFYDRRFDEEVNARHRQEIELRHAIGHDQLVMYYQPRIDVASGRTSSMEALVRWAHPTRGIVEPVEFIPLAEETGLIVELGQQVIDKVCAQIASWTEQGRQLVPVSINVSARQFDEGRIEQHLAASIARHEIDAGLVEVELTESAMSRSGSDITRRLGQMQEMGIKLLVDDFGTGYSSLSQLQQLDFDVLKVDRVFTARLEKSTEGNALFRAIITMAHELGMRVVAEGVETLDQFRTLVMLGCDEIQGFLVSKPMPAGRTQAALFRRVPVQE